MPEVVMGKLRPILFSTDMVKAILEGRKTQTRRIVNPQPELTNAKGKNVLEVAPYCTGAPQYGLAYYWKHNGAWNSTKPLKYKYGQVGDILWVRESFYEPLFEGLNGKYYYKADLEKQGWNFKWKPSIHMPFEACRLFLRVKSVRVERLQNISESDSKAEGIISRVTGVQPFDLIFQIESSPNLYYSAKQAFTFLWASINGNENWLSNPWVWVIEFERISKEEALK